MQILVSCSVTGTHRPRRPAAMYLLSSFILSLLSVEWPQWGGGRKGGQVPTNNVYLQSMGGEALISLYK